MELKAVACRSYHRVLPLRSSHAHSSAPHCIPSTARLQQSSPAAQLGREEGRGKLRSHPNI